MRWWLLLVVMSVGVQGIVRFAPGVRYIYKYWGVQDMQSATIIQVNAEVAITMKTQMRNSQTCRLEVLEHRLTVRHDGKEYQPTTPHLNFSNCFHFEMSDSGEVTRVQYNNDSEPTVLMLQKTLLSVLSGRLMISHQQLRQGAPWEYKINETGRDGIHESKYTARQHDGAIVFSKSRTKKTMENAEETFNKVTYYSVARQIPWKILQKSHFISPTRAVPGFVARDGMGTPTSEEKAYAQNQKFEMPSMQSSASVRLELKRSKHLQAALPECSRENMVDSTLRVEKIPDPDIPLHLLAERINGNVTCIANAIAKGVRQQVGQCFQHLRSHLKKLSKSDLLRLLKRFLHYEPSDLRKRYLVEAMTATATEQALSVVTEEIMKKDSPDPEIVTRVLFHLANLNNKPPKELLDVMENRTFSRPFIYSDPRNAQLVNERTILILGALVHKMSHWDPAWSKRMARRLEDKLSVHDPIKHRAKRDTYRDEAFHRYVEARSVYLYSLGNAASDSSFHHLLSYGNSTEAPLLWKKGAIYGISRYNTEQGYKTCVVVHTDCQTQNNRVILSAAFSDVSICAGYMAANSLLAIALTDPDYDVKATALFEYEKHPFGAVVGPLHEEKGYRNTSNVLHARTRRSLDRFMSRIWKGFDFKIQSPSVDWRKKAGGSLLGASIGVLIKNLLDVKISPLSSHVKVDVHNKAWMTIHLGVIGSNINMYRAEICYKGSIGFDLNILKEFNFESVLQFARKFERIVKDVHDSIINAVRAFNSLVIDTDRTDMNAVFNQLEQAVKQLPEKILNFPRIGKPLLKEIAKYDDMPPVVKRVEGFILKARQLFKDVHGDVTTLHDVVVDVVSVMLPWAWDEITSSFNDIIDAIRRITQNPKTAISDIGVSATRISAAIATVLAVKEQLDQANIFKKGNTPYWFDKRGAVAELQQELQELKASLNDTMKRTQADGNKEAQRYTGLEKRQMRMRAMQRILDSLGPTFDGPLGSITNLVQPFYEAADKFSEAVKNIKNAWEVLKNGYEHARTLLESVFGVKIHKDFPRKYLLTDSCGGSFYPSTSEGRYKHTGVGIRVAINKPVLAPFQGRVWYSGENQVTLKVRRMRHVIVVMENVRLLRTHRKNNTVSAGERIGTVVSSGWCREGHIHFSMIKTKTKSYINPSRYLEKRSMPQPGWQQICDYHWLLWKGFTIAKSKLAGPSKKKKRTPKIKNAPDLSKINLDKLKLRHGKRRSRNGKRNDPPDWVKILGLPDIEDMSQVFDFRMTSLKMANVLNFLNYSNLPQLKTHIENYLKKLGAIMEPKMWQRPGGMDENELRRALSARKMKLTGSRKQLLRRYRQPRKNCAAFHQHLKAGMFCDFDPQCRGFSCVADMTFMIYRQVALLYASYDPCIRAFTLRVNNWYYRRDMVPHHGNNDGSVPLHLNKNIPQLAQLSMQYKLQFRRNYINITLAITWCNTKASECQKSVVLVDGLKLERGSCGRQLQAETTAVSAYTAQPNMNLDFLMNATLDEIIKQAQELSDDPEALKELVDELRKEFTKVIIETIRDLMVKVFENEFELDDFCTQMYGTQLGPYTLIFFELTIDIPVLFFDIGFRFEAGGSFGVTFECSLCLLSMKVKALIRPYAEPHLSGALRLGIPFLTAELKVTGYVFDVSLPLTGEIEFHKFPLEVGISMDIDLVPLRITLHTSLIFEMNMIFFDIRSVLVDCNIFEYSTPTLRQNIFSIHTREPDKSPPRFGPYSGSPCTSCGGRSFAARIPEERQISTNHSHAFNILSRSVTSGPCSVVQVRGRDYTDPAFNIEFAVDSDRSEVDLDYCVGTVSGGCDQVNNEPLGGPSSVVARRMVSGLPLYFTVCATNSAKLRTCTTTSIPTYDTTLPTGRVTPDFHTTSHPNILRGSALVIDDSDITSVMMSAGYGRGHDADQLAPWQPAAVEEDKGVDTGDDPHGLRVLEKFSAPRQGRLVTSPYKVTVYPRVQQCAKDCLTFPTTRCRGFNYEHKADGGPCELLHEVESHEVERHRVGGFMHYERYGIGHKSSFNYTRLQLGHNYLYFHKYFIQNIIGYQNVLPSPGVLADFTPPLPGVVVNGSVDILRHVRCDSFVPMKYRIRCATETPLPNFRLLHDGPGSSTVYNGHRATLDERYTRANKSMSANWEGFRDPQTGILVYTWSIGRELCGHSVYGYTDPHDHLPDETQWNNQGLAQPLKLTDGNYFVTIRAMNKIQFGGPMTVSVCHTTPYTVDTTPPEFYYLRDVRYDSNRESITFIYNATDPHSGIKRTEFGLGRSRRDTALLSWKDAPPGSPMTYYYKVPDGVPAWVKLRVTNNVDLRTSRHADRPILVDTSPPIAGVVYDGENVHQGDLTYQSSSTRLCASWTGFYDPESGIWRYRVGAGTSPHVDDVAEFEIVDRTVTSRCWEVQLQHNTSYFSTVTAYHNGHDKLNVTATSSGVLVDVTPPNRGQVYDGKPGEPDVEFSSNAAVAHTHWRGFMDPESGLTKYRVACWRKHDGDNTAATEIHADEVMPNVTTWSVHHLHLHHRDAVHVVVTATNGANSPSMSRSSGFSVDLTEPRMHSLSDGPEPGTNARYTSSTTELSATWNFTDPESGLDQYAVTAYQTKGGTRSKVFPARSQVRDLPGETTVFTTDEPLNLEPGLHYNFRVAAVNRAKLTSAHQTDGVIVDNTSPQMMYVNAGSINGEGEELEDGYVIHNEQEGLWASWRGFDPESGVETYQVAIGTSPGGQDTLTFTDVGNIGSRYMKGFRMSLTDPQTNTPVYHVTVKCINGAGLESLTASSSPVKIVEGDKTGLVEDGPAVGQDIDYQTDITTITASFHGFSSVRDGIAHYLWGVGTAPLTDDVMPFMMRGIVVKDKQVTEEKSRHYHAQALLQLSEGKKYFTTVRAVTGSGNVLETSSNGVTVDRTPPNVRFTQLGPEDSNITGNVVYQREPAAISASWNNTDGESGVNLTIAGLSDIPGTPPRVMVSELQSVGSIPNAAFQPSTGGRTNIVTLFVVNQAGLDKREDSISVLVDETPPDDGRVQCPKFIAAESPMLCRWDGYVERESRITSYKVGLGTYIGDDSLAAFSDFPADIQHYTFTGLDKLGLDHGKKYFVTVSATNAAGRASSGNGSEVIIDDTPPKGNLVVELHSTSVWNFANASHSDDCKGSAVCSEMDVTCQRSVTQISAAFEPFTDPESGIVGYEISVGNTPGGSQIKEFTPVHQGVYNVTLTDLDLSRTRQAFVTIKGYNGAGQYSAVTSNGVYISRISAGLVPIEQSSVFDGDTPGRDQDYQSFSDSLSANWDLRGDPCPLQHLQWSIRRVGGHVVLPYTDLPIETLQRTLDELQLVDGETYFTIVRATNLLGYTYGLQSDGITIQVDPLVPGVVRDGPVVGFCLTTQPSITTLSANWDGFGTDTENPDTAPPNDDMEAEKARHQEVAWYEVAAGNDRRFPLTRTNVHPFVNVGLNKTWTFENLQLIPRTATYYMTVRAYSVSTAVTEVTSSGIRVGVGGSIVTYGEVNVKPYVPSDQEVEITWKNFRFIYPTIFYRWGIGTYNPDIYNINCTDLGLVLNPEHELPGNYSHLFDIHELTTVVGNTYVKATGLSMFHNTRYHVAVLAVDQSGECMMSATDFRVDITPPETGTLSVGHDFGNSVVFVSNPSTVMITWSDYHDPESDVTTYEVALVQDSGCSSPDPNSEDITYITLNKNITDLRAMDLGLLPRVPYYVILRTRNGAGKHITTISKTILLDPTPPTPGTVIDGPNIMSDLKFQSSLTQVKGSLLYLPSPSADACPYRRYNMAGPDPAWRGVQTRGMNGMTNRNVTFQHRMVKHENRTGVGMELRRDVTSSNMLAPSIHTTAHIGTGGNFKFELKCAEGILHAVTSVCFREGPEGEVWDFMGNSSSPHSTNSDVSGTVIPDDLRGDTSRKPNFTWNALQGFGIQIRTNATENETSQLLLWSKSENRTVTTSIADLKFDPSEKFHRFELVMNENIPSPVKDDYQITVRIDDQVVALMTGLPTLSNKALFQAQVWNEDGWLAPLYDVFDAPRTMAYLRNIEMPPYTNEPCRYAETFRGGQSPVESIYAGIGTTPRGTEVESYRKVESPCLPCSQPCMECNRDCSDSSISNIGVHLNGLSLPEPEPIFNATTNSTSLQVYYLTVKMVTGSGQEVVTSSNGFYIDVTPPEVMNIMHLDPPWSPQQPVTHQGSNDTIMVVWMSEDKESEITDNHWAIGTRPGEEDIQNFTSVGTNRIGYNNNLAGILQDNTTYYVTLKVTNEAGLVTTVVSGGVTVLLSLPDESKTGTGVEGTEPIGGERTRLGVQMAKSPIDDNRVLRTRRQDSIKVTWDEPTTGAIGAIFFSLSSDADLKKDIFPQRQVGYNNSGMLEVSDEGFFLYGQRMANMSDMRDDRNPYFALDNTEFFMEPGRIIYTGVEACTKAHKCGYLDNKIVIVMRDADRSVSTSPGHQLEATMELTGVPERYITIRSPRAQSRRATLVYGQLSNDDLRRTYTSAASNTFSTFISNPVLTENMTDRTLYRRIERFENVSIFLTAVPGQPVTGPLEISYPYDPTAYTNDILRDFVPSLLTWDTMEGTWIEASNTCPSSVQNHQINNGTVTVTVCGLHKRNASRTKRSTSTPDFTGPQQFITALLRRGFVNNPPVLTSSTLYTMLEDSGTLWVQLQAHDPENDTIRFSLDTTQPLPLRGEVTISADGRLTYRPCTHCAGTEIVRIKLTEDRTDGITALTTDAVITIQVTGRNHAPAMFNPFLSIEVPTEDNDIVLTLEQCRENQSIYSSISFVIGAVDVNPNDTLEIDYNEEGEFIRSRINALRNHEKRNCVKKATANVEEYVNTMVRDPNAAAVFPLPCSMVQNISANRLSISSQVLMYTPRDMFFGSVHIRVIGEDQAGGRSDIMKITVYVLENRCVNNGTCRGPLRDPDCTAIDRAYGFHGYWCNCPPGWDGRYCEAEIDECASSPCQENCTCIDEVNSYHCVCKKSRITRLPLPPDTRWRFAFLALIPVALIAFGFAGFNHVKKIKQKNKIMPFHPEDNDDRQTKDTGLWQQTKQKIYLLRKKNTVAPLVQPGVQTADGADNYEQSAERSDGVELKPVVTSSMKTGDPEPVMSNAVSESSA